MRVAGAAVAIVFVGAIVVAGAFMVAAIVVG